MSQAGENKSPISTTSLHTSQSLRQTSSVSCAPEIAEFDLSSSPHGLPMGGFEYDGALWGGGARLSPTDLSAAVSPPTPGVQPGVQPTPPTGQQTHGLADLSSDGMCSRGILQSKHPQPHHGNSQLLTELPQLSVIYSGQHTTQNFSETNSKLVQNNEDISRSYMFTSIDQRNVNKLGPGLNNGGHGTHRNIQPNFSPASHVQAPPQSTLQGYAGPGSLRQLLNDPINPAYHGDQPAIYRSQYSGNTSDSVRFPMPVGSAYVNRGNSEPARNRKMEGHPNTDGSVVTVNAPCIATPAPLTSLANGHKNQGASFAQTSCKHRVPVEYSRSPPTQQYANSAFNPPLSPRATNNNQQMFQRQKSFPNPWLHHSQTPPCMGEARNYSSLKGSYPQTDTNTLHSSNRTFWNKSVHLPSVGGSPPGIGAFKANREGTHVSHISPPWDVSSGNAASGKGAGVEVDIGKVKTETDTAIKSSAISPQISPRIGETHRADVSGGGWAHAQNSVWAESGYAPAKRARIMAGTSRPVPSAAVDELGGGEDMMEDDMEGEALDDDKPGRSGSQRLNHSEIEKRRRDKMNLYIMELAKLVPMCHDMNRKMDKLTVLRMAVQHIKSLRGESNTKTEVSHLPSFITDSQVRDLILQASDGFTFAISCDRGKILYSSESTSSILNYKQSELIGQNLFDFIHHKDISKVKDQLATNEFMPKERYIDTKTMKLIKTRLPPAHLQLRSGGRRMFVCRMRRSHVFTNEPMKNSAPAGAANIKQEPNLLKMRSGKRKQDKRNYITILCMGYIKPWVMTKTTSSSSPDVDDDHDDNEGVNLNSLIAVGLPLGTAHSGSPSNSSHSGNSGASGETEGHMLSESELRTPEPEFMSRHSIDGKFVYVDHRVTGVLGYVPQELTGTSIYEYCHKDSIQSFAELHKQVLKTKDKLEMRTHRFRAKDGSYVSLGTSALVFCNPWTKEREQVVCTHQLVQECSVTSSSEEELEPLSKYNESSAASGASSKFYTKSPAHSPYPSPGPLSKDVSNIGRRIADEIYRESSPSSKFVDVDSSTKAGASTLRATGPSPRKRMCSGLHITSTTSGSSSQRDSSSGAETTDEAAMAMIMNLLEADAGLGGPVDFNDLPWPL